MKKQFTSLLLALCLLIPAFASGSDLRTQQFSLTPFQSTLVIEDEFTHGTTTSGSVGNTGWNAVGTINSAGAADTNHPGFINLTTGGVSGTLVRINSFGSFILDSSNSHSLVWIVRLNNNDANTTTRLGTTNGWTGVPASNGIYFEKLDADTNWFCVARAATVQTRTDSTVAVTTNWVRLSYNKNSSGVTWTIDGVPVCGTTTTNIPATGVSEGLHIVNSAAAAKTIDMDYFRMVITGLVR